MAADKTDATLAEMLAHTDLMKAHAELMRAQTRKTLAEAVALETTNKNT